MFIAIVYYRDQMYLSLTIDRDTFAPADIAPLIPARGADIEKKGPRDGMSDQKLQTSRDAGKPSHRGVSSVRAGKLSF